ncbi:MAG: restriction endonuclease subunit S [Pseudoxanthomonas sp.]
MELKPAGWQVKRLDELADIRSGGTPSTNVPKFWDGDVPWCTPTDITRLNGRKYLAGTSRKITQEGLANSSAETIPANSVVMTSRATIGECAISTVPVTTNQGFKNFVPFDSTDVEFLYYLLQTQKHGFIRLCAGSTFLEIGKAQLSAYEVCVPAQKEEQSAIATALSEVDALLAGLDKLIAKQRDIKQEAMRQLLTGKTRLPGFVGDWEVRRLGDVGNTYGGLVGKSKADFGHGSAQYVTFLNVMANVVIDIETFDNVDVCANEIQNRVLNGDLLFNGSSETPEEVAMCALVDADIENLYLNSFCFGFRFKPDAQVHGLFMAYCMRGPAGRELIKSLAQGSTRYNLSKSALLNGQLKLPSLEEQTAIAEVLSDMDSELEKLQARREKTRLLKQGMMQELLTGRTRLV